ncbi:hypothetical protein NKT34_20895 [Paenibacillus polysaccharolyticus]|uniref:hypothetical protein n=1 Tax=Paenibacillus polysaccharolyticus TaxID=582692 RepID=UPI00209EE450|nr:hypothetical protein [Paenibacillus polysaccharolyticus]MCP1135761.1 hypothetical protein [Paenibacillus polysaccharolyticus]
MLRKTKIGLGALIGYGLAAVSSFFVPEFVTWAIPAVATMVGALIPSRPHEPVVKTLDSNRYPEPSALNSASGEQGTVERVERSANQRIHPTTGQAEMTSTSEVSSKHKHTDIDPVFGPVIEYLEVLEDMVISEGQKNELDNEIVEKSLALFARLQRVIPALKELNNGDINHTMRRLILKDLNGFINPFLRLSGEAKRTNRRMLLNGLKDVDSKVSEIVSTIEHKDLMELQNKAELIHQRYSSSEL